MSHIDSYVVGVLRKSSKQEVFADAVNVVVIGCTVKAIIMD